VVVNDVDTPGEISLIKTVVLSARVDDVLVSTNGPMVVVAIAVRVQLGIVVE